MTKQELLEQKEQLEQRITAINEELEQLDNKTLHLKDAKKPFKKWGLVDRQNLHNINIDAYMWLQERIDATIEDYNAQTAIKERVNYECGLRSCL